MTGPEAVAREAADVSFLLENTAGQAVARWSLWWQHTPAYGGHKVGYIGQNFRADSNAVILGGPGAKIGDNVSIGQGAVVANSSIGAGATIGAGAYVANALVPAGAVIPAGSVYTTVLRA